MPHWTHARNPDQRPLPDGWVTLYNEHYRCWYYVNTLAVPPLSSWNHPLEPPPSSPSPPPGSYAPPSSSPQNHSYGGFGHGGSPPYNQQQGQPYSEQHANKPRSYSKFKRLSIAELLEGSPSEDSDLRGIDPQEPRAYLQNGFPSQKGYAAPPPDNYENLGWQQGWQQPQQLQQGYAAQSLPHAIQQPTRGGRKRNAPADGGGLWAGTALLTEAFEHHENHEAERPYDQEYQEQFHFGASSMPRDPAPLHGHGSLRHRQHTHESYPPVGTNLINIERNPSPSRVMPSVTVTAVSPDAIESDSDRSLLNRVGVLCDICLLRLPHLEALDEHYKDTHFAPPNLVFDQHSAHVFRAQEKHQQRQPQPQPRHHQYPQPQHRRSGDTELHPYSHSAPPADPIFEFPHSTQVRRPQEQHHQQWPQPQFQPQDHQGPQPQHRRPDGMELYPHNYSAPPANSLSDSRLTEVRQPWTRPQPQLQPQDHQHPRGPRQRHQHPDDTEYHPQNPELRHYSKRARDTSLQVDTGNWQAAIKTLPNQSEFESRKGAIYTSPTMSPGAFWGRPGGNSSTNAAVGPQVTESQSEEEVGYFLSASAGTGEAQVRRPQEQPQQHRPRFQPHHQHPQRQQHQRPDDVEPDMDLSPAFSLASSHSLTPATTPLPFSTQQALANVSTRSLSQTSPDYSAITSPLKASQEITCAPNHQPGSLYSLPTPQYGPSFFTPADTMLYQHQLQAFAQAPPLSPLLSESFRRENREDLEAEQDPLVKKGVVVDGNDHTREPETELSPCLSGLFVCGVGDCQRRYKNIDDLRYHYQHSGDHGATGRQLLASGEHECLQHSKSAGATGQSTFAHSATMSPSSPCPGEFAEPQSSHNLQGSGQSRNSPSEVINTPHSPTREHLPVPPDPVFSDHVNATYNRSSSTQEHVPTRLPTSRILKPPDKLDGTLSCWKSNMDKLSRLLDRLHELASSARAEYRSQLLNQVGALRAMSKKHKVRFKEFLQLSEEYAKKYLLNISDEIQQERLFLDNLEGRVKAAKKFHGEVVHLTSKYEEGPVTAMKDLRATTLSRPLPEDDVLFKEVDSVLAEIRRCYKELDKFWMEEISRATEAYEKRRVDETDIKHWKIFCANLKQTLDSWKNELPSGDAQTLHRNNPSSSEGAASDIGVIASSMSSAMGSLPSTLDRLYLSNSVRYSRSDLKAVYVSSAANRNMCYTYLQQVVDYWEKAFARSLRSIASPTSSRAGAPQDLWEQITKLQYEMTNFSAEKVASVKCSFKFKRKYKEAQSLEQKLTSGLNTLLEKWAMVMDGHVPPGDMLPNVSALEQLRDQWEKVGRSLSAALADPKNEQRSAPRLSRTKRWLMNHLGRSRPLTC